MPTNRNLVPETTHFAVRNTSVAELQNQAKAAAHSDPLKSEIINSILKTVATRPGFGSDHALSVSGHFGLHFKPADTQAHGQIG